MMTAFAEISAADRDREERREAARANLARERAEAAAKQVAADALKAQVSRDRRVVVPAETVEVGGVVRIGDESRTVVGLGKSWFVDSEREGHAYCSSLWERRVHYAY